MRIHLKIFHKLFLTLLILSSAAIILMALFMRWSLDRGFLDYVTKTEESRKGIFLMLLEEEYREQGSWDSLKRNRGKWRRITSSAGPPPLSLAGPQMPTQTRPGADNPAPPREYGPRQRANRDRPRQPPPRRRERLNDRPQNRNPPPGRRPPPSEFDDVLAPIFDNYDPYANDPPPPPPEDENRPPPRITLFDADRNVIIGPNHLGDEQVFTPIKAHGEVVGWLGIAPIKEVVASEDLSFLKQQNRALMVVSGSLFILAALVSLFLTRHILKPVKTLAHGAKRLSSGKFDTRLPVAGNDEIAQLTADFNNLANTLSQNKKTRQKWVADISHELRTPLAVLRGELEALQDGIRQVDSKTVASLHAEVMGLTKMVEDLYQLSLADIGALKYNKTNLNPLEVLDNCTGILQHRFSERGLELVHAKDPVHQPRVLADEQRLRQLFTNLLENSSRYTDSGGKCQVNTRISKKNLIVTIEDTKPGIPVEKCGHLFERFFRTDLARSRKHGGAGLGLAICQKIVEAHEGVIKAEPSELGGLRVSMAFPLSPGA